MEPSNTPESRHKFSEDYHEEERHYRRKTRKRLIIITISSIVFVGAVLCAVIGSILPAKTSNTPPQDQTTSSPNVDAVCNVTSNQHSCVSSISSYMKTLKISDPNPSPEDIFYISMQVALDETTSVQNRLDSCKRQQGGDRVPQGAVDRCHTLYVDATGRISKSISSFNDNRDDKSATELETVENGMNKSAVDQNECKGLLVGAKQEIICDGIGLSVDKSREYTINSMEIASKVISSIYRMKKYIPGNRKLLTFQRRSTWPMMTNRWIRPEVFPLFASVGVAVGICVMQLIRNITGNPDVRVMKENRGAGVLDNFDEGRKYKEHGVRRYVRNKSPQIMPSINKVFSDPKLPPTTGGHH